MIHNEQLLITGAKMVLPDNVIQGDLLIENGNIKKITTKPESIVINDDTKVIDAKGKYLLPGMIDIHSDAIEKEISPRPKTYFPIASAVHELERKVAASGITTMYHSLSMSGKESIGIRSDDVVIDIIEKIKRKHHTRSIIRNLIHLRYEITHLSGLDLIKELIDSKTIDLLSFMDHTPGQGQYTALGTYETYAMKTYGYSMEEVVSMVEKVKLKREYVTNESLKEIATLAHKKNIAVASHDDDTILKIDAMKYVGVSISEFPINHIAAQYAKSAGFHVVIGAPNIVRGGSHDNNLRAIDVIRDGTANIICSDYHPSSMSVAVFKLVDEGIELPQAVRMASLNPSIAVGLDKWYGSIEIGKKADLILVELYEGHPFILKTIIGGKLVYQIEYNENNFCDEVKI